MIYWQHILAAVEQVSNTGISLVILQLHETILDSILNIYYLFEATVYA